MRTSSAVQVAQLRALYAPTSSEFANAWPSIAGGIADSLVLFGTSPTLAAVTPAQARARGLEQYLCKLRGAVVRERAA